MDRAVEKQEDVFKQHFKYYKGNKPPPSLNEVLIISQCDYNKVSKTNLRETGTNCDNRTKYLGLIDTTKWEFFEIKTNPGLIFVKNPFTSFGQRYWTRKCLEDYTRKPNRTNVDYEVRLDDWWKESNRNGECNKVLLKKMRWTTLGYHHNWDTKVYSEENKNAFPEDLSELCDVVANVIGYGNFNPEAAIINFYHMDSTLSPHTDHSEINLEAPLFSFSFGQSAIFLIGGHDKSVKPTAILLESGDILIMSKEARLCYHAVPKILPTIEAPWNGNDALQSSISTTVLSSNFRFISDTNAFQMNMDRTKDDAEWMIFNDYIRESRINMNVRQVKKDCILDSNIAL